MSIKIKPSKKGTLRSAMHTKKGSNISMEAMRKRMHSKGTTPAMKKKLVFAMNARKWKKEDGGLVQYMEDGGYAWFGKSPLNGDGTGGNNLSFSDVNQQELAINTASMGKNGNNILGGAMTGMSLVSNNPNDTSALGLYKNAYGSAGKGYMMGSKLGPLGGAIGAVAGFGVGAVQGSMNIWNKAFGGNGGLTPEQQAASNSQVAANKIYAKGGEVPPRTKEQQALIDASNKRGQGSISKSDPWYKQAPRNMAGKWDQNKPALFKDFPITDLVTPTVDYLAGYANEEDGNPFMPVGKGNIFKPNPNKYYRVVNKEAAKDFIENKVVRSSPSGTASNKISEHLDLGHRTTGWPSFSKGKPSMGYAYGETDNYIIETDRAMKVSNKKRHGMGSTQFPVGEDGKLLREFPSSEATLWKSNGKGDYVPHYASGGIISGQPNVEVEDGEVSQGPDGSLATIKGKSHAQGGEPRSMQPGTRIFSEKLGYANEADQIRKEIERYEKILYS